MDAGHLQKAGHKRNDSSRSAGKKIVIADESEQIARFIARIPGISSSCKEKILDAPMIADLVPEAMEEV